jgi:DNA-binding protein HU-alpha
LRQNEQVYLIGFGSFVQRNRPERQGKNPQTVEAITIKASNSVGFKPGKTLKEAVNYWSPF